MTKPVTQKLILDPFQRFIAWESSSGVILLSAAIAALLWANSPWKAFYFQLWHTPFMIGFERFSLSMPLHAWINDGLMAVFFFVVGLEIKREFLVGNLADTRQAILPIVAAVGGMAVPALLYCLINPPWTAFNIGWGIPTVTDIAFSLGVLTLLGNRVPHVLKVFLTALAIVDDLGAVLLIVLFYAGGIHWIPLVFVFLIFSLLIVLNRRDIRRLALYIVLGFALWLAMLHSGMHSTVAGVLLALCIPASSKIKVKPFCEEGLAVFHLLQNLDIASNRHAVISEERYQSGIQNIETLCEEAQAPLQRLEHMLHPWVTYGIMPLFAFANAGVSFSNVSLAQAGQHPIALGIVLGLLLGKPLGITLFSWLSVRLKLASLPDNVSWRHLYGLSCLGGIGFTMSLFIADLAFTGTLADTAKIAIIAASLLSGLVGWLILQVALPKSPIESTNGLQK